MAKPAYKMAYLAKLPFLFAGFFTASSLLAFYYRLIAESGVKWFRIALHCSVAFNILAWLPFVFAELFICVYVQPGSLLLLSLHSCTKVHANISANKQLNRPIHAYWSFPEPPGSRCLHEAPVTMAGGYVKIFVDLLITTLPIPLIMRMNMQRRQRYLVVMLLSLGYIVAIAGAIRTYYTWKALYGTNDPTWYQYPAFIASAIENNLAIVRWNFFTHFFVLIKTDVRLRPNNTPSFSSPFWRSGVQDTELDVIVSNLESRPVWRILWLTNLKRPIQSWQQYQHACCYRAGQEQLWRQRDQVGHTADRII
jgi:hypothetical protein